MVVDIIEGIENFLLNRSISYFGLRKDLLTKKIESVMDSGTVYSVQYEPQNRDNEEYVPGDHQVIPKIHHHFAFKLAGAAMMVGVAYFGVELYPDKINQLNQSIPSINLEGLICAASGVVGAAVSGIHLNEKKTGVKSIIVTPFPPKKY